MFKFLTSKPLWVNILAGIVLLLLLLLLFLGSLALLTQHGKTIRIPTVTGLSYTDAKKSLESGRENVNEVMYSVGYSDHKAFRNIFKKITGLSPLEYRNKYNREMAVAV